MLPGSFKINHGSLAAILILSALLFFPRYVLPQSNTGRMIGIVFDQTGAVVPGASVVVTEIDTQKERKAVTDIDGSFVFPLLEVGPYSVSVNKPGFKTYTADNVVIEVGRDYPFRIVLEVGREEISIKVEAGAFPTTATSAEISTTVNSRQI